MQLFPYNFQYIEQTTTFVDDKELLAEQAAKPGGCAEIAADYLIQFFSNPYAGLVITAVLCLLIALLTCRVISKKGGKPCQFLGLLPAVAVFFQHYNTSYLYSGTVAMIAMLLLLLVTESIKNRKWRWGVSAVLTIPLYYICGPIAMLYAILSLNPIGAILALMLGGMSILGGQSYELLRMVGPQGYYNDFIAAPSSAWMAWSVMVATVFGAQLLAMIPFVKKQKPLYFHSLGAIIAVCFFIFGANSFIDKGGEYFKELNCLIRNKEWQAVTDRCAEHDMNNILYQNCAYMAWAEQGELDKHIGDYPPKYFYSVLAPADRTPHVSAMLSEVYYSMGHLAFAQRYAFEANELFGGRSPQMLQMLVKTNIAYGAYAVAEKYINILAKTRYKDWAEQKRALLYDDKAVLADKELGSKRRCIFPDNRFSGIKGIDNDLKHVLAANPEHKITLSYLKALYILNGEQEKLNHLSIDDEEEQDAEMDESAAATVL